MSAGMGAHEAVRARVKGLPESVLDCEACGGTGTMEIRRSSLRPEPCADDCTLKCMSCYRIRTHGIPVSRETYKSERAAREGRVLDFVDEGPEPSRDANLKALGYIDY